MKKLISVIIASILFFSIANKSFAEEGYIEMLLDINVGIEEYDLELTNLAYRDFYSADFQYVYDEFVKINDNLKTQIIKKYRNGDLKYYQTKGAIKNHKQFVYYTDKLFEYLEIRETNPNYGEIDNAVMNSYRGLRVNYNRLKHIILK